MVNVNSVKVLINERYLTQRKKGGFQQAYLLAVDCRPNDIIRFTVLLETGAIWSGLPIEAIWCDKFNEINKKLEKRTDTLQPFTCLESPVTVVEYGLLKNAELGTKLGIAYYLFTINYSGVGLAEDPEQYKTHNVVVLQSGQLAALPNNHVVSKNGWFNSNKSTKNYKRSNKNYFAGA
jgi:hypothetical protein